MVAFGLLLMALQDPPVAPAPGGSSPAVSDNKVTAVRTPRPIVIDGRDDDEVWRSAPVISAFQEFEPVEGKSPRFRTEAKVAYDQRNLYVFARMFDDQPDKILRLLARRDVRTASDQIKIMVDSYHDRRSGYEFAVNPAGVKRDYTIYDDGIEDAPGTACGTWPP
jgi:hypothetical protein